MRGGRGVEEGDDGEEERQTHLRILMIYAPQSPRVQQQLVERAAVHAVRVGRNRGLLGEDNLSGDGWVDGEHAPVHEPAVAQVGVVDLFGGPLEHLVHYRLARLGLRFVDEEFDRGGE